MATLVEVGTERVYPLAERTAIGRGPECEIRLDDPLVSAAHAEIVRGEGGTYTLRDLGSRRGTYVGSRRLEPAESVELRDGDELLIGPARMRFSGGPSAPPAAPAAVAMPADELTRLRALVELSRAIGAEHDLREVLSRVLDTCFRLLPAERGAIAVYLPPSRVPHLTVARTHTGEPAAFALSTTVLSTVMGQREPYRSAAVDADVALRRSASLSVHGVRSLIAVPLLYRAPARADADWLGVIQLDSSLATHAFLEGDLALLAEIAGQASLGIQNALLVAERQAVLDRDWRQLERVVRLLPVGVVVLDADHRCVIANEWIAARRAWLGAVERGAAIDRLAGVEVERLERAGARLQVTAGPRILEVTTAIAPDERQTVIVLVDVTEERARQTQEAHRDRISLIGQLAGGIAHDFNNLLAVILTYASMLDESLADPAAREDLRMISRTATSASELTRQLLMFSRRELIAPRAVDVAAVVRGMDRLLRRAIGSRITLETAIAAELPRVLMDAAQLEQVVMNLVVNARDAIPQSGRVRLIVEACQLATGEVGDLPAGPYVAIEVDDTGIGMPPEVQARIFEPYFTTKDRNKGTGLGLATVQAIVAQAGGEIVVASEVGVGSTFRLYLPKTDRPLEAEVERPPAGRPGTGTVLLVDDDDDVRRMVERVLRRAMYSVIVASSGADALQRARAHPDPIDVLLTDLVMPGMSGQELARDLVQARPELRVVYMSGYHQGAPIDPRRFVIKPFDREELLAKVADALVAPGDGLAGAGDPDPA
jgi:signal transduction histidine kinase